MLQQVNISHSRCSVEKKHSLNAKLYKALETDETETVIKLCEEVDEHGLHILTILDNTVLHMATYAKKIPLVLRLLDELPCRHFDKLTRQNQLGDTILHMTAISEKSDGVARKLLEKTPGLLCMRNNLGETALFRSVRYGNKEMFHFFARKISGYEEENQKLFLQRTDKTTILHIAILSKNFELALEIAEKFEKLVYERDADGMTGLQLLSCNPGAFQRDDELGFFNSVNLYCSSTKRKAIAERKQKYESAKKLAKFLIKRDTSWEITYHRAGPSKPVLHKYSGNSKTEKKVAEGNPMSFLGQEEGAAKASEGATKTPLFLATISGCVQIVKEILDLYPQAVVHIDDKGRNILHVAIKYRQLDIFELVMKMKLPKNWLVGKLDEGGNSILHTVGKKNKDYVPEKMQGPALELQEEMHWFERVKEVIPPHFVDHRNNQGLTAEALFNTTNKELRLNAKEWIKRTAEGCTIVAVLIATVAFAAAYTIPGGSNSQTGVPVLLNHPFFLVFTGGDVLTISSALTSVVLFLAITASPFRFVDFSHSLTNNLAIGLTFLFVSVSMMMIAFAATIILMIHNGEGWTKVILYTTSFIPVGLFALSYFPLCRSLSKTYKHLLKNAWEVVSRGLYFPVLPRENKEFNQTSNSLNPQRTSSV